MKKDMDLNKTYETQDELNDSLGGDGPIKDFLSSKYAQDAPYVAVLMLDAEGKMVSAEIMNPVAALMQGQMDVEQLRRDLVTTHAVRTLVKDVDGDSFIPALLAGFVLEVYNRAVEVGHLPAMDKGRIKRDETALDLASTFLMHYLQECTEMFGASFSTKLDSVLTKAMANVRKH